MTNEEKKEFYEICATILGVEHEWNNPVPRRTRWNNRFIGNGRFPGFGLIRVFGSTIMVTSKDGTKLFKNKDEVFVYIAPKV